MPVKGIGIWIRKQKRNPYAGRLVMFVLCGNVCLDKSFVHTHAHIRACFANSLNEDECKERVKSMR